MQTLINRMLHLPNLLDSQKLFRYSHVNIINMVSNSSLSSDVAGIPSTKLKRKFVSMEKKLKICRRHKMGQSYTSLSKEYGLGKSTMHDIIQSEDRLTEYAMEIQHASGSKRSIIRRSKYDELDKALYLWFLQKQAMGMPVSGSILTAKAKILYKELYGSGDSSVTDTSDTSEITKGTCFKTSSGWLGKVKARHGICKLSYKGESFSASLDDVEPFKMRLSNIIEEVIQCTRCLSVMKQGSTEKCYRIQLLLMVMKGVQGVARYLKSELLFLLLPMLQVTFAHH